jgi:hypothetical protein
MVRYKGFPFMDRQWLSQNQGCLSLETKRSLPALQILHNFILAMMGPDRSVSLERLSKLTVIRFS